MKWAGIVGFVLFLAGLWLALGQAKRFEDTADRGPAGIEFVVPGDYTQLDLGETTSRQAAKRLLRAIETNDKVAAIFTCSGDRVQFLVNMRQNKIDERVTGQSGTLQRALWHGSVRERLQWAETHDDFAAPGLSPPERRNAYH